MAAGDLVVADWQVELRSTLMGRTTVYKLVGLDGLGEPPVRSRDVELFGTDGSYGSPDYRGPRVILVTLQLVQTSSANAFTSLTSLRTAWAPSTTDIPLYFRVPGWGKVHVDGRPRGLEAELDVRRVAANNITCIGEFHALTPTIT